ncbi:uncharacterized protein FIBRA_01011 [Fibroporia radiculosa]|uniref:Thioredoxin domain-containing protein n=1 Tax=Fibroporia radiculosa TaxID=599839 RepID=J4G0R1_9APHY|nr:uncharacterized protein FIBRA_01011 [Fibroporia radiculosa]CCL99003.1 predicted protein [Fibroporia radiculosa]
MLARLPYTLLATALAVAVQALPVDSTELTVLTPDNFESTISEGVWFIEHFSPYCGHCRKFLPTWTQLVENNAKQADPGIRLAQVNCAINGDLCSKNGVDGYPQMNLYRNGQFVESYGDSREYELLTAYLSSHAEPTSKPKLPPTPTPEPAPIPHAEEPSQDGKYDPIPEPARDLNPRGAVLALTDKTFGDAIKEGTVFIKFYAPWCGHCKKLAPIWTQLAGKMQHKLTIAEVNCEAHDALCRNEGVTGFPMLVYYGPNGGGKTEYTGGRKLEQLKAFSEKVIGPAIQEVKYEDLPSIMSESPSLYLLLHPPSDSRTIREVLKASSVLFGSPPIYSSSSSFLYDYFSVQSNSAVILALKDHDDIPAAVYRITHSADENSALSSWLLRNRLPSSMELDADNFQEVMNAPHKPLVVLIATPKDQMGVVSSAVQKIARQWKDTKGDGAISFVWMDGEKWGKWLKSMYGIKADSLPRIVVANHARLVYYDKDQFGEDIQLTSTSIFSAIHGAAGGTIPYKHSENMVERMARYLNAKLTATETYVFSYPWRTAFFIFLGIAVIILVFKRLFAADSDSREYSHMRKADRLD